MIQMSILRRAGCKLESFWVPTNTMLRLNRRIETIRTVFITLNIKNNDSAIYNRTVSYLWNDVHSRLIFLKN